MYKEIESLCRKTAEYADLTGLSAKDSLAYSQAALNLAHVIATLKAAEQLTKE